MPNVMIRVDEVKGQAWCMLRRWFLSI